LKYFYFLLVVVLLSSCGPKVIYENQIDVPEKWAYKDSLTYSFEVSDTLKPYDITLDISHNTTFGYENLYIYAVTVFPEGRRSANPVSLQLANSSGDWIGKCSGDHCQTKIQIASASYFKTMGKYKIIICQHSRQDLLEGIRSVGLKISESETPK
jgi:gliding motility-associated lipoprotein GldH